MADFKLDSEELGGLLVEAITHRLIKQVQKDYGNPVDNLLAAVVNRHAATIEKALDEMFRHALTEGEFVAALRTEFSRRLAKTLLGKAQGAVDKSLAKLMEDPTRRARLLLRVDEVIKAEADHG